MLTAFESTRSNNRGNVENLDQPRCKFSFQTSSTFTRFAITCDTIRWNPLPRKDRPVEDWFVLEIEFDRIESSTAII